MKFTLKDYQSEAVIDLLEKLENAVKMHSTMDLRTSLSLSAPTGAGKTVMAAAALENLLVGTDDFDTDPIEGATVIWFSDDPSLNDQSKKRLDSSSEMLSDGDNLITVETDFTAHTLDAGKVYFLNTQKLSSSSRLTRGHDATGKSDEPRPDGAQRTIWDIIRNTIEHPDRTLILMVDEAHRGLGKSAEAEETAEQRRSTILSRLINGHAGIPPVPVVVGISATVNRFEEHMDALVQDRTKLPGVVVPVADVQDSGLVKDTVILDTPTQSSPADTALVRRAAERAHQYDNAWKRHHEESGNGGEPVVPLMVVQLPDNPNPDSTAEIISAVLEGWPGLKVDAFANVFGEHRVEKYGPYSVPYVAPQHIQDRTHIRVLLAKNAISTGWDCPRAEVMVSLRSHEDDVYITQLIGRMVRTPMARRIPGDETLNSVVCLLPKFNVETVEGVIERLSGRRGSTDTPAKRVLVNPVTLSADEDISDAVWDVIDDLPTYTPPARSSTGIRRLDRLAQQLSDDGIREEAPEEATGLVVDSLLGAITQHRDVFDETRQAVTTIAGSSTAINPVTGEAIEAQSGEFSVAADAASIRDAFHQHRRAIGADVADEYVKRKVRVLDSDNDPTSAIVEARADIAAAAQIEEIVERLHSDANRIADEWLAEHRRAIIGLGATVNDEYNAHRTRSDRPTEVRLARPISGQAPTAIRHNDGHGNVTEEKLPTYAKHLLVDERGQMPLRHGSDWESKVLDSELKHCEAWYRNPESAKPESLAIPYEHEGKHKVARPDYLFFSRNADGTVGVSIVDPHGHHFSDALPRMKGIASYAEKHGDVFQRIDMVAEVDNTLKVLDLTDEHARETVAAAKSAKEVFLSNAATEYK